MEAVGEILIAPKTLGQTRDRFTVIESKVIFTHTQLASRVRQALFVQVACLLLVAQPVP